MTTSKWVVSTRREAATLASGGLQSSIDRHESFHLILINEAADLYEQSQAGDCQRQRYRSPTVGPYENCIVLYGVRDEGRASVMQAALRMAEYATERSADPRCVQCGSTPGRNASGQSWWANHVCT
jgi:hypothetical protein